MYRSLTPFYTHPLFIFGLNTHLGDVPISIYNDNHHSVYKFLFSGENGGLFRGRSGLLWKCFKIRVENHSKYINEETNVWSDI